ncbi:Ger(x)C family spore germination protein [Salibacterium aidingense]|uniref:Ger(x)C family spore germination protein n=1 Tax=Salibacterium aidingense TaxID=384933 RepID=UPI003BCA6C36
MKRSRAVLAICTFFFLSGCLQSQVIDDISLIQTVSFDKAEGNKLRYTVFYPFFVEQGKESEIGMEHRSIISETPEEARSLLNTRSQKPLRYGQLRVVLFGREVAEEGVEQYVKSFYRNPRIGNRVFLSAAEGSAGEALRFKEGVKERIGMYFSDLIEHNMDFENIPETNMHLFLFDLYSDGKDAFLPLVKREDNELKLIGLGLFDFDKMVGTLDMDQSFIFKLLLRGSDKGTSQFAIPKEGGRGYVVIQNIFTNVSYDLITKDPVPEFNIHLKMKGEITDHTGEFNLEKEKDIKKIETVVQDQIKTVSKSMIQQFKEKEIDPLGFGEKYRSRTRNWKQKEWKETIYPEMKVNVDVNLEILQSGAIE